MDIYFPYIRVSTHGHVQNIGQIPQKPFLDISSFWNIYKGNILQKFQGNSIMSYMTYLIILQSLMPWRSRKHPQTPSKPFCPYLKFGQLYIAKLVQMLSNLVHMLECPNKASIRNGTRFGIEQLDQITPKPLLFKFKFEQLYIVNFLI